MEETAALQRGILKCEATEKHLSSCEKALMGHEHAPENPWTTTEAIITYIIAGFSAGIIVGTQAK